MDAENLRIKLYLDVVRILKSTSYIFRNNLGKSISISMIGTNDGIIITCRKADTAVAISEIKYRRYVKQFQGFFYG